MSNIQSWIAKTFPSLPVWASILCMLIPIGVTVWIILKFLKNRKKTASSTPASTTTYSRKEEWRVVIIILILVLAGLGGGALVLLLILSGFKKLYELLLTTDMPQWLIVTSIVVVVVSILYFLFRRRVQNLLPKWTLRSNHSLSKNIIHLLMIIVCGTLVFYGAKYLLSGTTTNSDDSSRTLPYVPTYTMVTPGTHTYVKGKSYSFVLTDDRDFYLDPISDGEVIFTYVNITHPHTWKIHKKKNGDAIDRTITGTISAYNNDKIVVSVDRTADIDVQIVTK